MARAKSSPKRRRIAPEQRRAELLLALEHVLAKHGYAGSTVPKVVAHAGTAQGSFYRHFRDIDHAFVELTGELTSPIVEAAFTLDFSHVRSARGFEDALLPFYRALATQLAAHPAAMHEALMVSSSGRGGAGRELASLLEIMRQHVESLLQGDIAGFRIDNPGMISAAILGMVLGAAHEATNIGDKLEPEAWARAMAKFEVGGLIRVARRSSSEKDRR